MRLLAGHLATPILLVNPVGTLLFFNEPAEALLGKRFDETGEMLASAWAGTFEPTDPTGAPMATADLPFMVALRGDRPVHRTISIRGLDAIRRCIEVSAFPLIGLRHEHLGAVAALCESSG